MHWIPILLVLLPGVGIPTYSWYQRSQLHKVYQSRCTAKNSWWWAERLPETCRVVIPIKLEFSASVGVIHKQSVTMHGHTIVKLYLWITGMSWVINSLLNIIRDGHCVLLVSKSRWMSRLVAFFTWLFQAMVPCVPVLCKHVCWAWRLEGTCFLLFRVWMRWIWQVL